jgi:hypothetical protein
VELYNRTRITRCHCVTISNPEKNGVFWDVTSGRSCVNRRFGEMYRLHLQGRKIRERETSVSRWLQIGSTIRFSETSVHTRSTWFHIPENGILHSHRSENLSPNINNPASYPGGLAFDSGPEAIVFIFLVVNNQTSYVQAVLDSGSGFSLMRTCLALSQYISVISPPVSRFSYFFRFLSGWMQR